uniref:non-specific serine/threonine protein kinase n=1 Tax=Chenopodium quinoa TaxID=63459 RepID=A0A803KQ56_CHEQI
MEEDDDKLHTTTTMVVIAVVFFLFLSTLSLATADDATIMKKLSSSLDQTPPNWLGENPCKWQGVSCDSSNRVTSISLASSWSLPNGLSESSSLQECRASNTNLVGSIPDIFGAFPSLKDLRLSYNNLTGSLPDSFAGSGIQYVWINNQKQGHSGVLDVLGKMPSLAQLWVQQNAFFGPIPDLSNCTSLFDLQLRDNQLTGVVPPSLSKLPHLVNISMQNNKLQGPMSAFARGVQVSLGFTNTFVRIHQALVILKSLRCLILNVVVVNFAKQNWGGFISPSFANLTSLTSIILNGNDLVGTIPSVLTNLKMLQRFDVSNNSLTGKVPNGNPFLGTSVDTTKSLKSPPDMTNSPSGTNGSPSHSLKSRLSSYEIAGIVIAALVLILAAGVLLHPRFKSGVLSNGQILFDHGDNIPIEVLREVTDNFSDSNILGRGGFGIVYKGVLQDGTGIAVKRMESNLQGSKGKSEFEAEITVLTKVRHRHLVALLGYCVNGNERIAVYEYMPQGTLGHHLFEYDQAGQSPLTWKQRLVIALDVARGVEYLHSLAQQSFIHRDLKPSNVLLGDNMRAKVSDFGLVKSASDQGKYSLETRLAGTFGYLAPKYAGKRVLITKEGIRKAIDPKLETDDEEIFESICKVAELSGHCTTREPQQRPDMSHAVNVLSPLVE